MCEVHSFRSCSNADGLFSPIDCVVGSVGTQLRHRHIDCRLFLSTLCFVGTRAHFTGHFSVKCIGCIVCRQWTPNRMTTMAGHCLEPSDWRLALSVLGHKDCPVRWSACVVEQTLLDREAYRSQLAFVIGGTKHSTQQVGSSRNNAHLKTKKNGESRLAEGAVAVVSKIEETIVH